MSYSLTDFFDARFADAERATATLDLYGLDAGLAQSVTQVAKGSLKPQAFVSALQDIGADLASAVAVDLVRTLAPDLATVLQLCGVFERKSYELHLERIGQLVSADADDTVKAVLGYEPFDAERLGSWLVDLLELVLYRGRVDVVDSGWEFRLPVVSTDDDDSVEAEAGVLVGTSLEVQPAVEVGFYGYLEKELRLGGGWTLALKATGESPKLAITEGAIGPESAAGTARLELDWTDAASVPASSNPVTQSDATGDQSDSLVSFEMGGLAVAVWSSVDGSTVEYGGAVTLHDSAIRLRIGQALSSSGDGFLAQILPPEDIVVNFTFGLAASNTDGVHLVGDSALEAKIPLAIKLGPISLTGLDLGVRATDEGAQVYFGVDVGADLSVLALSVGGIGAEWNIRGDSSVGEALQAAFRPPKRVGLLVRAGPLSGGGYLDIDPDTGRYAGLLALKLTKWEITAVGIINTKMPDGSPGFALLALLAAKFSPGIPLPYNFRLQGIGGLFALNRRADSLAILDGVRDGSIDAVTFPTDPVANAPQIIDALDRFFPIKKDNIVVAPMVLVTWNDPAVISIEVAVVLSIPEFVFALLGQLSCTLPKPDDAVIRLNIDFAGVLDVPRRLLALDASLRDSKVLNFDIYGDTALRLSFGDDPQLLFSAGGFNPAVEAPPGFPALRRLGIAIGFDDNPRITLEGYFACTSNTVQFGAHAELYAKMGSVSAEGGLSFDALCQFDPFLFRIDFGMRALLRTPLGDASARLAGLLSGPTPYDIQGVASIEFAGVEFGITFHKTFGDSRQIATPTKKRADLTTELVAELGKTANWRAVSKASATPTVRLRKLSDAEIGRVVDIGDTVVVSQQLLPLGLRLERYGTAVLDHPATYDVVCATDRNVECSSVEDAFAPGQYLDLSDDARVSQRSFEQFRNGVALKFSGPRAAVAADTEELLCASVDDEYEDIRLDPADQPVTITSRTAAVVPDAHVLAQSSSGRAYLSNGLPSAFASKHPPLGLRAQSRYELIDVETGQDAIQGLEARTLAQSMGHFLALGASPRLVAREVIDGAPDGTEGVQ